MQPDVELLELAPATLSRPLALVGGRAYAAAWPFVRRTLGAGGDAPAGRLPVGRLPPTAPLTANVATRQALWVVRDDGRAFGEGADEPLRALGLDVRLGQRPPSDRLWSTPGLQAYRQGARPEPPDVFERLAAVVDRFIDFDRSLAPQRTMVEFVAAYALSTWLLEAFGVVGFLWPSGDRGTGKTNLLHVVAQLSYLGTVLAASGSFASLRDLADYGAALAFDDAEQIADSRKGDPDLRALLLAGNRRGAVVTVKEPAPGGQGWQTRYVIAFCPRLFSAIRLPDPVLASRSIVIPLVRTADRARANADPLDFALWPHDRQALVDDLWALALASLPSLPAYDGWVAREARLSGRSLQPWRAVLAIGRWLEGLGVRGLYARLEGLALAYQDERPELEADDLTTLVVRAILALCTAPFRRPAPAGGCYLRMADLVTVVQAQADHIGLPGRDITAHRLGRVLARLRIGRGPRVNGKEARQWLATRADLERWSLSYNLRLPELDNAPADLDADRAAL